MVATIDWERLFEVEQSMGGTSLTLSDTLLMEQHLERVSPFLVSPIEDTITWATIQQLLEGSTYSDLEGHFWFAFVSNFSNCINTLPHYTKFVMYSIGITTPLLRNRIWGLLTGGCDSLGLSNDVTFRCLYESIYQAAPPPNGTEGATCGFDRSPSYKQILLDVNRTFPQVPFFKLPETQVMLLRILNAYLLYDIELGYCQGLAFLAGALMYVRSHKEESSSSKEDEQILFVSLCKILEINKSLRSIFDAQMSGLEAWFTMFADITRMALPAELITHMKAHDVDPKVYLSQWFLSFFGATCEFRLLIRIMDVMILEGFKPTIFRIATLLLLRNRQVLMGFSTQEQFYHFLLSKQVWAEYEANEALLMLDLGKLDPSWYVSTPVPLPENLPPSTRASPRKAAFVPLDKAASTGLLLNALSTSVKNKFKGFSLEMVYAPEGLGASLDSETGSVVSETAYRPLGSNTSLHTRAGVEDLVRTMNDRLSQLEQRVSELELENINSQALLLRVAEAFFPCPLDGDEALPHTPVNNAERTLVLDTVRTYLSKSDTLTSPQGPPLPLLKASSGQGTKIA